MCNCDNVKEGISQIPYEIKLFRHTNKPPRRPLVLLWRGLYNLQKFLSTSRQHQIPTALERSSKRSPTTTHCKPEQQSAQLNESARSCPRWVDPRMKIICYQCYKDKSHIAPHCAIQLADVQNVADQYEKLRNKQKVVVPVCFITIARQYIMVNLDLAIVACDRDIQPRPESHNW